MEILDLKKQLKEFYNAKPAPVFLTVPPMQFIKIDGEGNPNTSQDYSEVLQTLYTVAYTLKFRVKKDLQIDYPVMALEGLWWTQDMSLFSVGSKDNWQWTMMISLPDMITQPLLDSAIDEARRKKDLPAIHRLRFETYTEGLSAQLMHIGPYSAETENIKKLHAFIQENGYNFDGSIQKHHEIYLSDPNRTAPEKLKTIIRQPVIAKQ
ncbi:MAG: GyrI-like domain-containing protein [Chloroflexota bacterium]